MHIKPNEKYIVLIATEITKTESGIYLPDSKDGGKKYLKVVQSASKQYKKGQIVVPKGGVMEVKVGSETYFILHEDDICAIIEK